MPDAASRLPARPSLEQLRKQAKERLKQLRANDPAATLADAQLALAREYGFESWPKLVHHVQATNPPGLAQFEQLALALAAAYTAGDFTRIREVNWEYGTSYVWEREITRMQERLPTWFASTSRTPELALADARHLVARHTGFETWDALVQSMTPGSAAASGRSAEQTDAQFYRINWATNTLEVHGPLGDAHWDDIIGVMRERQITGLSAGGITDAVLERVSRLDQITLLNIEGGLLTDDGMPHLARLPRLADLVVGGPKSGITDRGLEVLRHLTELKRFQMCWAPLVTDAGVANLTFCDRLENVNLMGTFTGDGAVNALRGKRALRHFSTGQRVTDAGLPLLHDFPVFKQWQGGEMKYDLMSFEAEPNGLLLDGPITDRGLAALAGLDGLFGLNFFWHCPSLTGEGLAVLSALANLGFLGCHVKRGADEGMRHIAAAPRLRMLMAQGTIASDDGFTALSKSPTIEYIWGRECPNLGSRGFAALEAMPALKGIAVSCRQVDDAALSALPRFPALTSLMPMDVPDAGFRHVGGCEQLERLWCMYCRDTGDTATEHLTGLSRLKTYYAGMTRITDHSLEILGRMPTLEKLEFWQTAGVTDAGLPFLARLPRLREVSLEGLPRVTREGVAVFPANVRVSYSG